MKSTKIYCGRNRQDGTLVRIHDVHKFLAAEVATQYEVFTVTHATGYRYGDQEETFVIEVITHPGALHTDYRPAQIAQAYKTQFDQQAVLITTQEIESNLI